MITRVEFSRKVMELLIFAFENGIRVQIDYVYRSSAEQKRLYEKGRSKVLESRHNVGKAIDLHIVKKDGCIVWAPLQDSKGVQLYKVLGKFWESFGPKFRWGGNFDKDDDPETGFWDPYHFEVKR